MTTNIDPKVAAKVKEIADEMFAYLCTKNKVNHSGLKVAVAMRAGNRLRSYGGIKSGGPFISLRLWQPAKLNNWIEYRSIGKKSFIGDIRGCTYTTYVRALAAHEVAHAFDYHVRRQSIGQRVHEAYVGAADRSISDETGHSLFWQKIYRDLRVNFVNKQTATTFDDLTSQPAVAPPAPAKKKTIKSTGKAVCVALCTIRTGPGKHFLLERGVIVDIAQGVVTNSKGTYLTIVWRGKKCRVNPFCFRIKP